MQVYNVADNLAAFRSAASGKPLDVQISLWNSIIENADPAWKHFYSHMVWEESMYPDGKNPKKPTALAQWIPLILLPDVYARIQDRLASFEALLKTHSVKFAAYFPDFVPQGLIFATVNAGRFDGKCGEDGQVGPNGENMLAFGFDTIVCSDETLEIFEFPVLSAHEFFHLYQCSIVTLPPPRSAKMSRPLWLEGLATYASWVMYPTASRGTVLLDAALGLLKPEDIRFLAVEYLKIIERDMLDEVNGRWFRYGGEKIRDDLPWRCGYGLGLYMCMELSLEHPLVEMAHWPENMFHTKAIYALEKIVRKLDGQRITANEATPRDAKKARQMKNFAHSESEAGALPALGIRKEQCSISSTCIIAVCLTYLVIRLYFLCA
ncbi:hypothetical protein DFJ77DRAFT_449262 [Powellomyces hirtus]|nr:hypothetical protein DFJ77DRAFT_449262 [Powellomyces hirtus]